MSKLTRGTRIVKVNSEPGDAHPDGCRGTIVGISPALETEMTSPSGRVFPAGTRAYFVVWDDLPGLPVGTMAFKVKAEGDNDLPKV